MTIRPDVNAEDASRPDETPSGKRKAVDREARRAAALRENLRRRKRQRRLKARDGGSPQDADAPDQGRQVRVEPRPAFE